MPLYNNYGRVPGKTPSGRNVKYSKDEARAAQILADVNSFLGAPGKYTQQEIDWAKSILPDTAPVISQKRLASAPGIGNPLDAFAFGVQRFGRLPAQSSINAFNAKYGTNITGDQLLNYPKVNASPINAQNSFSLTNPTDDYSRRQAELDAYVQSRMYKPPVTAPAQQFGITIPSGVTDFNTSPFGPYPIAPSGPSFQANNPTKDIAANSAYFNTEWNDQNDPGGFIRKQQTKVMNPRGGR